MFMSLLLLEGCESGGEDGGDAVDEALGDGGGRVWCGRGDDESFAAHRVEIEAPDDVILIDVCCGCDGVDVLAPALELFGKVVEGLAVGAGKVEGGRRGCVQDAFMQGRDEFLGALHECGEVGVVVDVGDERVVFVVEPDRVCEYGGDVAVEYDHLVHGTD